jgi:hypothetical protein
MSAKSRSTPETHAFNKAKGSLIAPPFYKAISKTHPGLTKAQYAGMKTAMENNSGVNEINSRRPGFKAMPAKYTPANALPHTPPPQRKRSLFGRAIGAVLGLFGLGGK